MTVEEILSLVADKKVEFIDLRVVDVPGTWHHITVPISQLSKESFVTGFPFDGSSLRGFKEIQESDMVMLPDATSAYIDPFFSAPTLVITCDVYEPGMVPYDRDPRTIAKRAESYLQKSGVGDAAYFGPELEFFIFDDVRYDSTTNAAFYEVNSSEAVWNTGSDEGPNLGHKIRAKGGYFPVPPVDQTHELRTQMVQILDSLGFAVERHHHEVATGGQQEINFRFDTLTHIADKVLTYKYVLKNVAKNHGKTVTFMPKPLFGDNGSGMHTHQSLFSEGEPLFYEKGAYGNLSQTALYYIGGLLQHAPAVLAFTNPSTNSYKRLVPGFEAPVNLVYSYRNRSAAIRIPVAGDIPKATRIEFRTPDSTSNPYLAFTAMLMAGLDGIKNKIDPVKLGFGPFDKSTYTLSKEEKAQIRSVPSSLDEALDALEKDQAFLLEGGVFTKDFIESWVDYKRTNEADAVRLRPHPYEFSLYYDI